MKKVLLMIIDACTPRVLEPAMRRGHLPNLLALSKAGFFHPTGSSIFPSITHAALASLATGCYPAEHGIIGSYWYDQERQKIAYYCGDLSVILSTGVSDFFNDLVIHLNSERLQAKTLFQIVERGKRQAACLNHLIYRGNVQHEINVPWPLRLLPGISTTREVYGPSILHLGNFISSGLPGNGERMPSNGLLNWFGWKDDSTADLLIQLAEEGAFPDFTLAYFPENDWVSHRVGPQAAVATLEHFDKRLGDLFASCGGMDALLDELCLIITADHSQSSVVDNEAEAAIDLDFLLSGFTITGAGRPWQAKDDLMVCPNMRAVQIYFRELEPKRFHHVIARLLDDKRIDQVVWRADITETDTPGYRVATRDRGALHFWPGESGPNTAIDAFDGVWSWAGSLRAVDGQLLPGKKLIFPCYPNAFERIAGALNHRQSGHLWATAQVGYEFRVPRTVIHPGGGSHGSLHADDSAVPVIMAGAPADITLPDQIRAIDIAPLCLSILGMEAARPIGASAFGKPEGKWVVGSG